MIGLANIVVSVGGWITAEDHHFDDKGYTSHNWLLPETAEIIYGGLASIIVFSLLYKFGRKPIAKMFSARTARIQGELDDAAAASAGADAEATRIRQALGDIQAERQRLLAQADEQAASLLTDGRARLETEVIDLEVKADADIVAAAGRSGDELRNEIARLASRAADTVVAGSLDDATQQRLIDDFIQKVGAS
ncbi:MAG: F0F1 ATP synthase subunit B [Desertimonas sp.]